MSYRPSDDEDEEPKKEPKARVEFKGWGTFRLCEQEDFVNCTYGFTGDCRNPRHVASGREDLETSHRKQKKVFKKQRGAQRSEAAPVVRSA